MAGEARPDDLIIEAYGTVTPPPDPQPEPEAEEQEDCQ